MRLNLFDNILFYLTLLIVFAAAATYCAVFDKMMWTLFIGILALLVAAQIVASYRRNFKKIKYMVDAIDSNDYMFRYSILNTVSSEVLVNKTMNKIKEKLFQNQEESANREVFYERVLDSINTGVIVMDENGYVLLKNAKVVQLFGLSFLSHVSQMKYLNENLAHHLLNPEPDDKFYVSLPTEQGVTNLSVIVTRAIMDASHVYIVAFNDIKSELDEKELDSWIRLTRVLTHEIMNSVTPITSISNTLLASLKDVGNKDLVAGLETIGQTGKSLISFVESYRKFTHIPAPEPTLVYVKALIDRNINLLKHRGNFRNIAFETDICPQDLIVYADESLIGQVVLNIFKNAMQAIGDEKADGKIFVKAYSNEKESVVVEISNNGPAIPEEELAQIFVPFFTTKKDGSGVGLSISRQIMRLSGGTLTVKENDKGLITFVLLFK